MARMAFGIQFFGNRQSVRIGLDYCTKERIKARDLIQIIGRKLHAGKRARIHQCLEIGYRRLDPARRCP